MENIEPIPAHDTDSRAFAQRDSLTAHLCQALKRAAFSNNKPITPRDLDDIARKESETFFKFVRCEDEKQVQDHGRQLAQQGMGHLAVLGMTEALRRYCRESVNPGDEVAGRYVIALLDGYIVGRERLILREQERTREAFLRVRERRDRH